jgi:ABC-type iron transport system FetAB permease component
MFRLAHAHGTLLNLVLIVAAISARLGLVRIGRITSVSLCTAVVLLPIGFLIAGIWHFKDDPGIAILLVPVGALLLLLAAFQIGYSVFPR